MNKLAEMLNPSEEKKQKYAIEYLSLLVDSIRNHCCSTCKNCEIREAYMHSYKTTEMYCNNKQKVVFKGCDNYAVDTKTIYEIGKNVENLQ